MNVIIIDDETLALTYLEKKLRAIPSVNVIGQFTNVSDVFSEIFELQLQPDVIFLDINMPDMNGLEAAEAFIEQLPNVDIVFVTAHDQYAVQAFDLNAIDYLLKPVTSKRLMKTMDRLKKTRKLMKSHTSIATTETPTIQCFRRLTVTTPDGSSISWRTNKAKQLFALLLHHHDHAVHKDALIEALWPSLDLKKAHNLLYTTIYLVRKTVQSLSDWIQIESKSGSYKLTLTGVNLDYEQWEADLKAISSHGHAQINEQIEIFNRYTGDYFEEEAFLWVQDKRERLRMMWFHFGLEIGENFVQLRQLDKAIEVYLTLKQRFPDSEPVAFELMRIFEQVGDYTSVHRYYEELCNMLEKEHQLSPQPKIKAWYEQFNKRIESEFKGREQE